MNTSSTHLRARRWVPAHWRGLPDHHLEHRAFLFLSLAQLEIVVHRPYAVRSAADALSDLQRVCLEVALMNPRWPYGRRPNCQILPKGCCPHVPPLFHAPITTTWAPTGITHREPFSRHFPPMQSLPTCGATPITLCSGGKNPFKDVLQRSLQFTNSRSTGNDPRRNWSLSTLKDSATTYTHQNLKICCLAKDGGAC